MANFEISGAFKRTQKGNVNWYYGGGEEAWPSLADAKAGVPIPIRACMTVGVIENQELVEYVWHPSDTSDNGLIRKTSGVEFQGTAGRLTKFNATGDNIEDSAYTDADLGQLSTDLTTLEDDLTLLETDVADAEIQIEENRVNIVSLQGKKNLLNTDRFDDVTAASVERGAIIVGKDDGAGTITWTKLTKGNADTFLKSNGTDLIWATINIPINDANVSLTELWSSDKIDDEITILQSDIDNSNILTQNHVWIGNALNNKSETTTVPIIVENDVSTNIFTDSYLITNHGNTEIGQWVENVQQASFQSLIGWVTLNKNGEAHATLDLSNTNIYSGVAGSETLDISSVNTATIITLTQSVSPAAVDVFKITGGIDGRRYFIICDSTIVSVTMKTDAAPTSNEIVCLGAVDKVVDSDMDNSFEFLVLSSVNYQIK